MIDKRTKRKNRVSEVFINTLYGGNNTCGKPDTKIHNICNYDKNYDTKFKCWDKNENRCWTQLGDKQSSFIIGNDEICKYCENTNCNDTELCSICPECHKSNQLISPLIAPAVAPAVAPLILPLVAPLISPEHDIEYYIRQLTECNTDKEQAFQKILNAINTILITP